MILRLLLMGIISLGLFSCAPSKIQLDDGISLESTRTPEFVNKLGDVFFLLTDTNSGWIIADVSQSPLKRVQSNQEILTMFHSQGRATVQPYFEFVPPKLPDRSIRLNGSYPVWYFICNYQTGSRHDAYSPCNSAFVSSAGIIDAPEIVKVAQKLDLYGQASSCRKTIDSDNAFLDRIKVQPKVQDLSGLYRGEKILSFNKSAPVSCGGKSRKGASYSIYYGANKNFSVELPSGGAETVGYSEGAVFLTPKVIITHKKVNHLAPQLSAKDKRIEVTLLDISGSSNLYVQWTANNFSDEYVSIKTVSIYVDDVVLTTIFSSPITLAPHSKFTKSRHDNFGSPRNPSSLSKVINTKLTKAEASKRSVKIGLAFEYKGANTTGSATKVRNIKYLDMIGWRTHPQFVKSH